MDLFKDINQGKFGKNQKLKKEAKHELGELGGMKKAEAYEKKVKVAGKMTGNSKEMMEKNNRTMLEIDRHNTSWNGKKYTK